MSDFRKTINVLDKMTRVGIQEVIKIISKEKDPLVKLMAARRFKRGIELPHSHMRISSEFKILGTIYRQSLEQLPQYGKMRSTRFHKGREVKLTKKQKAQVDLILQECINWVYKYWSSVITARLVVRGGGFEKMEDHIFELGKLEYRSNMHRKEYRDLLITIFR
jgi:hypothetical protein